MKTLIFTFSLMIGALPAFANNVILPAGGSVRIGQDIVSCQGPTTMLCSIKTENGLSYVYQGDTHVAGPFFSDDDAITAFTKLKNAGACP